MRASSTLLLGLVLGLVACQTHPPAPVVDRLPTTRSDPPKKPPAEAKAKATVKQSRVVSDWRPDTYTVKKGDTLYSIGLEHGYDYKEIAQANDISAPYTIKSGQTLKLGALKDKPAVAETVETFPMDTTPIRAEQTQDSAPTMTATEANTVNDPAKKSTAEVKSGAESKQKIEFPLADNMDWAWPTQGKVTANFNESGNKGIDIAGSLGQAVNATATGKVIYSGSGLRGYGKLVIVKHNPTYLSVYAHNNAILVKEGQMVVRGQKIAEMGNTDSNAVKLHFEIRRQGKSVDPNKYLAAN